MLKMCVGLLNAPPTPRRHAMARPATFDRETWCTASTLIRRHGTKATAQAAKATLACLAEKNLDGALACMWVAEAVTFLLADKPEDGERIH
jgi:hypothetical protein